MKRSFISIFTFLFTLFTWGQLQPLSNQYIFNGLAINPAYSGSREALSTTMLYRNQWVGLEGAPKTMSFSLHAPLRKEKIGLGLLIINDKIGVTSETSIVANYAYRMDIANGKLALGLGAGLTLINTAWSELVAIDPDDELLMENSQTFTLPDFSVGAYYTADKFFLGLSIPLFLSHQFNFTKSKFTLQNNFSEYNYLITAGNIFVINTEIKIFPALLMKYNPGNSPQIDLYSHIIYREKFWVGISYRSKKSMVGIFQYQINNQLRIAYSCDFDMGNLGRYNSGSHEIMMKYDFNYLLEVISPRYY